MRKILQLLFLIFNFLYITGQTNCITTFGTLLGSFNGVNAYSNCNANFDYSTVVTYPNYYNFETGINTGLKYQCVEFVNRYYKIVYGLDLKSKGVFGNANSYFSNANSAGLSSYPNGGSVSPQVGDILCSNGGSYGNVAIIKNVNANSIDVIQQNFSNSNCYATLSRTGNTISGFSSNYPIEGWIRYQTTSLTPSITSVSPNPISGLDSQQIITINGNNFTSGCTITLKDLTNGGTYTKSSTYISSSQIQISANFTNNTAIWSVQVTSPSSSNVFQFQVIATPNITSVSPNPVLGSNSQQLLTINGTNFSSGCTLTLKDLTNGGTFPKSTTFINSSQLQISANFTNNSATWSAEVSSPVSSNVFQFQVLKNSNASVDDFNNNIGIMVYPNPVKDFIYITSDIYTIIGISFYTMDGILIETKKINRLNKVSFNTINYPKGTYFMIVTSEGGKQNFKILK